MVQPDAVGAAIRRALPDAQVSVEDLTGGGDHLQVTVVSSAFATPPRQGIFHLDCCCCELIVQEE